MTVSLRHSAIIGAITTATATRAAGELNKTNYQLIGRMTHSYGKTTGSKGVDAALDATSRWFVNKTSYLTGLTLAAGAVVSASEGFRASLSVNGRRQPLVAGAYKGNIVLSVNKN